MPEINALVESLPFVATGIVSGGGTGWMVFKVMFKHHEWRLNEQKYFLEEVSHLVHELNTRVAVMEAKGG